ncbi:uncharacterized protein [Montipora capricornis]|uniref:uncharacterized protein n=1 Tax=Montipora capricornis TaxID=246305 RepID=UPI0035F1AE5C
MFEIVEKHLPSIHCYADDTQLYVAFSPNQPGDDEAARKAMGDCIRDLRGWMVRDHLKLNEDKTEVVLIGTRQQLAKVNVTSIAVGDETIEAKPSVRNLGSWFDSQLSMSTHISKAIHGFAPPSISELISIKAQRAHSLRSANGILLSPSIIKARKARGDRAFQVAAPQLWNALPLELRQNTPISSFKRCLKTHLFRSAFQ